MKLCATSSLLLLLNTSVAYQVGGPDGTRSNDYRQAIERSTRKSVKPLDSVVPSSVLEQGPSNYWFHPKIHTFGNTGVFGALHAAVAPLATKLIDVLAYDGANVRDEISKSLRRLVDKDGARVLDLCCGVGISTRSLHRAFCNAEVVVGVDTSPEMVAMAETYSNPESVPSKVVCFFEDMMCKARGLNRLKLGGSSDQARGPEYIIGNAESTCFPDDDFDLVTIMYAFHEAPYVGRTNILREARRLLPDGATLAVIDISPDYCPSQTMLAGEPYVIEYQSNIQNQLRNAEGFSFEGYKEVVPGHVGLWLLKRDKASEVEPAMKHIVSIPSLLEMGN